MLIYHLVLHRYWNRQPPGADYVPAPFATDGFIHCTKGAAEMARVANRMYRQVRGPHVYLYIDSRKVKVKIKYEDPGRKYPHIYGPLNRDAIVAMRIARRRPDGRFLPPDPL